MKQSRICALGLVAATLLFPWEQGSAQTVTTTIPVSATVAAACSVSGTGVNFGNYEGRQLTATGTITVTCSANRSYNVTLNGGTHGAGSSGPRNLQDLNSTTPGVTAFYFLYKDSAMTQEWGDAGFAGTYTPGTPVSGTGTGSVQTLTIYGKLPANQIGSSPGNYTDTVLATVIF